MPTVVYYMYETILPIDDLTVVLFRYNKSLHKEHVTYMATVIPYMDILHNGSNGG